MNKESDNQTTFNDQDILVVELTPYNDNVVVPNFERDPNNPKKTLAPTVLGKAKDGPFQIEVQGQALAQLMTEVEPEPEAWDAAVRKFEKNKKRQEQRIRNHPAIKSMSDASREEQVEAELKLWCMQHSVARTFFEDEHRGRLPIKEIKILENKGPRHDDHKARVESDREFMDLLKQKLKNDLKKEVEEEEAKLAKAKKTSKSKETTK